MSKEALEKLEETVGEVLGQYEDDWRSVEEKVNSFDAVQLEDMDKVLAAVWELEYMKSQMVDSEGNVVEDGKYKELLKQNPDMAWRAAGLDTESCKAAVMKVQEKLKLCGQWSGRHDDKRLYSRWVLGELRRVWNP